MNLLEIAESSLVLPGIDFFVATLWTMFAVSSADGVSISSNAEKVLIYLTAKSLKTIISETTFQVSNTANWKQEKYQFFCLINLNKFIWAQG